MKQLHWASALLLSAVLVACGGGSGGVDVGDGDGGDSGGGDSGGGLSGLSCDKAYSPEKVVATPDACQPKADELCPVPAGLSVLNSTTLSCTGVTVEEFTVSGGGLTSTYLAIYAGSGPYDTVYMTLHYLMARAGTHSNVVRMPELAKARNTLILVPQAPGAVGGLGSRWPVNGVESVSGHIAFLDAVVADARVRFSGAASAPLLVSGLSNGAVMAYQYACAAADRVAAVQAVAGSLSSSARAACQPTGPLGTVIVHGSADAVLAPYSTVAPTHAYFEQLNGCSGSDTQTTVPTYYDPLVVKLNASGRCAGNRRDFLVVVEGGGHNWPGGSSSASELSTIGLFGAHTRNFDATLQGYDLLRLAAGAN